VGLTLAVEVHAAQGDVVAALAVEHVSRSVDAHTVERHVGDPVHVDVVAEPPTEEGDRSAVMVLPIAR
jgi:hypothetical protein